METLALLNHPVDHQRLADTERSVETGQLTSGEEMATQRCGGSPPHSYRLVCGLPPMSTSMPSMSLSSPKA